MKIPRTRLVNFRVTPEEYAQLAATANAAGLCFSDYVRTQLILKREQVAIENQLAALTAAIERIAERRRIA